MIDFSSVLEELGSRAEAADNRPEREGGDRPELRWFKMEVGDAQRKYQFGGFLMPYASEESGRASLFRTRFQHYRIPVNQQDTIIRTCMAKSLPGTNTRCPFCEAITEELETVKGKEARKAIYQYEAKAYAYANILPIILDGRQPDYTKVPYLPHILKISDKRANDIAQYLRNQGATVNMDVSPLNPFNALPLFIDIEKHGPRKMDVRYSTNFGITRSAWAGSQQEIDYLQSETYDLTAIFRVCTPEEYSEQWDEVKKFKSELARRRANRSGAGSGYDAPANVQYAPPTSVPQITPPGAPQQTFAAPAPAPGPVYTAPQPAPAAAPAPAPVMVPAFTPAPAPGPAPAPIMGAPTPAPVQYAQVPQSAPVAPSIPTPAPVFPSSTGSQAPTTVSAPSAAPSTSFNPPQAPTFAAPPSAPQFTPPQMPTSAAAPGGGVVMGAPAGFQQG